MSRWFRRFTVVGAFVTLADIAILLVLRSWGLHLALADAISVALAATLSYRLHRRHTFGDDPRVRLVQSPGLFGRVALLGLAIDVVVLLSASQALPLVPSKLVAIALAAGVRLVLYRRHLLVRVREDQELQADRPPPPGDVRFSIVVPAFREGRRIAETVGRLREALAGYDAELVIVDDGSGDDTAAAARAAGADQVIELPRNRGKGAAVRAGMLAARGRARAFTDADLSYPPAQLLKLLSEVERGWDVVVGSRLHEESTTLVEARPLRDIAGRAFNTFTNLVLLGQYRDTQCGLKAFRSDAAMRLFRASRIDGFAFDVELFHLVERYRLSLHEVPVALANTEASTVRVAVDSYRMVRDLFRIRWLASSGVYDTSDAVGDRFRH